MSVLALKINKAWLIIPIGSFSDIKSTFPIVPEQLIIKSFGFTVNLFI